jgi:hypothetical protein
MLCVHDAKHFHDKKEKNDIYLYTIWLLYMFKFKYYETKFEFVNMIC